MKEILYIHGYNSSGATGRILEKLLKDFTKVHHFPIPQNPEEALSKIKTYLKSHENISLIVGSSLGGFITSRIQGYMKLLINPCMFPSIELPKIGCDTRISDLYKKYESRFSPDYEDRMSTFLMFGNKDELFSYKDYCEEKYLKSNIDIMDNVSHHLNEEELSTFIVPKIKKLMTETSKKLFEHFENI